MKFYYCRDLSRPDHGDVYLRLALDSTVISIRAEKSGFPMVSVLVEGTLSKCMNNYLITNRIIYVNRHNDYLVQPKKVRQVSMSIVNCLWSKWAQRQLRWYPISTQRSMSSQTKGLNETGKMVLDESTISNHTFLLKRDRIISFYCITFYHFLLYRPCPLRLFCFRWCLARRSCSHGSRGGNFPLIKRAYLQPEIYEPAGENCPNK